MSEESRAEAERITEAALDILNDEPDDGVALTKFRDILHTATKATTLEILIVIVFAVARCVARSYK